MFNNHYKNVSISIYSKVKLLWNVFICLHERTFVFTKNWKNIIFHFKTQTMLLQVMECKISKLMNKNGNVIFNFWFSLLLIFNIRFLIDLHVLRCPKHDFIISRNFLSICDKNFVASVVQELIDRIHEILCLVLS